MTRAPQPSAFQYLRLNGTFTSWFPLVFLMFLAWVIYSRVTEDPVRFSPYLFLVLLPLAAGTGLLTAARSGRLDLLFGAGLTRFRLWTLAFILAWVVPSLLAALLFAISGVRDTAFVLTRLPAVLLFAGGISFAAGLVEMRYTIGVLWLLTRLIFMMTMGALEQSVRLSRGELPTAGKLVLMVVALPEIMIERGVPVFYLVAAALTGIAALVASCAWFLRADFGGKRS